MKCMGFQIVFNISKIKKTLQTDWPNTFLPIISERGFEEIFWQNRKGNYGASFNTQKSTRQWIHFFFSKSILLIYFRALNQQSFRVILAICYFGALWACHACLTSPKKKFMIKLQLPWISYCMQKVNLLPEIVFQILKFKKLSYYPIRLV